MALDNFANLKQTIIRYTGRDDLSNVVEDFITIAESKIYANEAKPLRIRQMEANTTLVMSTSSRELALPTDYLEARRVQVAVDQYTYRLDYQAPMAMKIISCAGVPRNYTITSAVEFDRTPDQAYSVTFDYYARPAALSSLNPTNAVLTNYPQIYLHGALWQVYQFSGEEDKSQQHYSIFLGSIASANGEATRGRYGPGMRAVIRGSTP